VPSVTKYNRKDEKYSGPLPLVARQMHRSSLGGIIAVGYMGGPVVM
jgi:hypothetical protein